MDKIIEAILKLIPFSQGFEKLGLSKEISASLSVVLVATFLFLFVKLINTVIERRSKATKAIEDLKPQFDYISVKKASQLYIETQYQNASPTRQEEPGFTHKYIARNKLIPFFINTAFNGKLESDRFYLVLADSGMGKTTFMINLYKAYYSFFGKKLRYNMKLLRFSNPDTIPYIKSFEIDEARNTILLLDALDEDLGIISKSSDTSDAQAFQDRVDEIIEITRHFREVVMTCRTQYFPGQEEDPYELKVKRPDEKGYYTLNKLYISPFNDKEVKKYLNKKFGRIPFLNRKKNVQW